MSFGVIPGISWFRDNLVGHVHTFDDFTESGVLTVKEGGFCDADKELAAAGISLRVDFVPCASGGDGAPLVFVFDFGRNGVARATGTVGGTIVGIFALGIAALDHETGDHAVKGGAVVESFFDEFFKVLGMLRAVDGVEFDDDDAVVCGEGYDIFFNDGRFHVVGFLWGRGWF